jgi:uncharacterized membrane protein/osmotically-inducible protein OsmY
MKRAALGGNVLVLMGSFVLGAAFSQVLDPVHGRRRRALIRDKAVSAVHAAGDAAETTSRDVANRSRGVLAGIRSRMTSEDVSDDVLVERVRAEMGGVVSHPHAVSVTAEAGYVTLRGPILMDEMDEAVRRATAVRGVTEVDNQLQPHASAEGVPGLQGAGGPRRAGGRFELWQQHWSPTARLLAGVSGAALAAWGGSRAGLIATAVGGTGLVLLARAATNLELRRLFGIGAGRHAVVVQKTLHLAAPIEEVYEIWSRYENFPALMENVREVRRSEGDGGGARAHWCVTGPLGLPVYFDTVETRRIPNEQIAWKTIEGGLVAHAGIIRFDGDAGGTRVHLQMSYNPPGGALGHALAVLLGADPRQTMHLDLVRLKSLFEDGKTRAHGRSIDREAIG